MKYWSLRVKQSETFKNHKLDLRILLVGTQIPFHPLRIWSSAGTRDSNGLGLLISVPACQGRVLCERKSALYHLPPVPGINLCW